MFRLPIHEGRRGPKLAAGVLVTASFVVSTSALAAAPSTTVRLEFIAWNAPAGTHIKASVRANLKLLEVSKRDSLGVGGEAKIRSVYDQVAVETGHWEVIVGSSERPRTEMAFEFPVNARAESVANPALIAGELFTTEFEIAEPGASPGSWVPVRSDKVDLGLFLRPEHLASPGACIRFIKAESGYAAEIAYNCSAESFAEVRAASTDCPTCRKGGD